MIQLLDKQDYNDSSTLVIWAHVLQSWLATTAGFPVQTDSNTDQWDSVWSPRTTSDTLPSSAPCQAVLVKNPELQVLSNALPAAPTWISRQNHPTKSWWQQSAEAPLETQVSMPRVCTRAGKWVALAWMGISPRQPPAWAAGVQLGTWRRKSPQLFLLQLFITNKASLRSGSVVWKMSRMLPC